MLEAIIKFAGFGYLMALSVLGYAVLLEMIKNKYKGGGKQKMIRSVATIFHFLLGISGIMFGAFTLGTLMVPMNNLAQYCSRFSGF